MPTTVWNIPFCALLFALLLLVTPSPAQAADTALMSKGGVFYVAAYSHVFHGPKNEPLLLTINLSMRNTDPNNGLVIRSISYHGNEGGLLKEYVQQPVALGPLASYQVVVPEHDVAGGFGANFLVHWQSEKLVNQPVVESVMISTRKGQGISFTSRGAVISP